MTSRAILNGWPLGAGRPSPIVRPTPPSDQSAVRNATGGYVLNAAGDYVLRSYT